MPNVAGLFMHNLNASVAAGSFAPIVAIAANCSQGDVASRVVWTLPNSSAVQGKSPAAVSISAGNVTCKLCRWGLSRIDDGSLLQLSAADIEAFSAITSVNAQASKINLNNLTPASDRITFLVAELSGPASKIPRSCSYLVTVGNSNITGNLTDLPSSFVRLVIDGASTVGGDITNWNPTVSSFQFYLGPNTTPSGSPAGLPKLSFIGGSITIEGGTITGPVSDFSASNIIVTKGTITGSTNAMDAIVKQLSITSPNASFTCPIGGGTWQPTQINMGGTSSATGDLSNLWPGIVSFSATGTNNAVTCSSSLPPSVVATLRNITVGGTAGSQSPAGAQTDILLASLAGGSVSNGTIDLAERTTASNANVTTLLNRGWVINIGSVL